MQTPGRDVCDDSAGRPGEKANLAGSLRRRFRRFHHSRAEQGVTRSLSDRFDVGVEQLLDLAVKVSSKFEY